ncbi:MAG: M48 family metallopeptidase [Myxococcota bacterium]
MEREPALLENNVSPGHPLAELATLLGGLVRVGLGLLLAIWLGVEIAVRFLPASVEQRVFGGGAGADAAEEEEDAALAALLERLAGHGPVRGYDLQVGVVDVSEPNAFALPGGNVLVTRALLERAGSENEVAFVLAHELGHVEARDPLRGLGRGVLVALALSLLGVSDGAAVAGSAAALGERAFSRDQESAADRFALARVYAEYGHVAGASDFLRRLPDAGPANVADRAAGWLATHPRSDRRVADLEALARAAGYASEGPLTPLPPELRSD